MPEAGVLALLAAAADQPSFDPEDVTPGLPGFLVTFGIVVVVVFLLRDFTRRVRRLQFKGEQLEREAAERAEAAEAGGPERPGPGAREPGAEAPGDVPRDDGARGGP